MLVARVCQAASPFSVAVERKNKPREIIAFYSRMSYTNSRMAGLRQQGTLTPLASTCYIQQTITGDCATVPTAFEPSLRGLVPMYSGAGIVPGGPCGSNTSNSGLPCLGGYCSDLRSGVCLNTNALYTPGVNLRYTTYGTRL